MTRDAIFNGSEIAKMCFIIPILWPVNTQSGVTTIEILFDAILYESVGNFVF